MVCSLVLRHCWHLGTSLEHFNFRRRHTTQADAGSEPSFVSRVPSLVAAGDVGWGPLSSMASSWTGPVCASNRAPVGQTAGGALFKGVVPSSARDGPKPEDLFSPRIVYSERLDLGSPWTPAFPACPFACAKTHVGLLWTSSPSLISVGRPLCRMRRWRCTLTMSVTKRQPSGYCSYEGL